MEDNVTDIEASSAFDQRVKQIGKGACSNGHKPIPRINQNKRWVCPECDAPKSQGSGLINNLPDPGHEAMVSGNLPKVKEDIKIMPRGQADIPQKFAISLELDDALAIIEHLPMPSDMKRIKKLLKVKQLIKEILEEN